MQPSMIKYYQELAKRLDSAKHGSKSHIVQNSADTLGISINKIYEELKKVGYESGRKIRADYGDTHIDLSDARLICNMIYHSRRQNDKRLITFKKAIEIAYVNNEIKEKYHPSTLARIAREHGFHPDQLASPTPSVEMQSLHPNHVWQVDASVGVLFYLKAGGVQFFNEMEHYKNKPDNLEKVRKHLCIRYVMTDHYSGSIFVYYYAASGENQEILFDFIARAFTKKEGEEMHGVPTMIVMDKGAANTSHLVTSFLDKMQIINYAHGVGNSRAKGSVVKAQDIVERNFEGGLKLTKHRVKNIEELNKLAKKWRIYFNANEIHRRTNDTRNNVWRTIKKDQLRIAPSFEIMQSILTNKPEERTVTNKLRITYKGKGFDKFLTYSVENVPNVKVGEKVLVTINPFRAPNIDIEVTDYKGNTTYYECSPLSLNEGGFYAYAPTFGEEQQAASDTITDKERKAMLKKAYGVETLIEAKNKEKKGVQLFDGKLDPMKHIDEFIASQANIEQIPKRGTQLDIEAPRQVLEKISIAEACKRLKAEMSNQYPNNAYQQLSKQYPDGIDPLQIEKIKSQLITRQTLKIIGE